MPDASLKEGDKRRNVLYDVCDLIWGIFAARILWQSKQIQQPILQLHE
jgi:hypothetical protein